MRCYRRLGLPVTGWSTAWKRGAVEEGIMLMYPLLRAGKEGGEQGKARKKKADRSYAVENVESPPPSAVTLGEPRAVRGFPLARYNPKRGVGTVVED